MSLSPNISSIISITLSIGLAVTITLFTTSELIPRRRRLKSGGLHLSFTSIKHLCKILKGFIFTSTSTNHWPPSKSWKLYQKLHMSIENYIRICTCHQSKGLKLFTGLSHMSIEGLNLFTCLSHMSIEGLNLFTGLSHMSIEG